MFCDASLRERKITHVVSSVLRSWTLTGTIMERRHREPTTSRHSGSAVEMAGNHCRRQCVHLRSLGGISICIPRFIYDSQIVIVHSRSPHRPYIQFQSQAAESHKRNAPKPGLPALRVLGNRPAKSAKGRYTIARSRKQLQKCKEG